MHGVGNSWSGAMNDLGSRSIVRPRGSWDGSARRRSCRRSWSVGALRRNRSHGSRTGNAEVRKHQHREHSLPPGRERCGGQHRRGSLQSPSPRSSSGKMVSRCMSAGVVKHGECRRYCAQRYWRMVERRSWDGRVHGHRNCDGGILRRRRQVWWQVRVSEGVYLVRQRRGNAELIGTWD